MEETIKTLGSAGTAWYFCHTDIIYCVHGFYTVKMKGQKPRKHMVKRKPQCGKSLYK